MSLPAPITPRPSVRRKALLGTAIALVLGGSVAFGGLLPNMGPAVAQPVTIAAPAQMPSFADVVEQVSPAVVGIRVRGEARMSIRVPGFEDVPRGVPEERFYRGVPETDTRPTSGLGSGFFVSADGYVVTNNHVIDGATEFTVLMQDGTQYPARLVGRDDLTDLALLKVDADRSFRYVEFASADVRVGDWVIAVGTPFGLNGTVTAGIVSARGRQIGASAFDDFIQIDAAVNIGNSGGPAFNLAGQVMGVNTAIYSPSGGSVGIAFAVPASIASKIVADLREFGSVQRGWLGVQLQTVSGDMAAALGLAGPGGAIVVRPIDGSPALAAGVRTRDVVIAVDGAPVANSRELARTIGNRDPNTPAVLSIIRDGERVELTVTLGVMPAPELRAAAPAPEPEPAPTGLGIALATTRGGSVVVADLDPMGTAAAHGLRVGDRIVAVGTTTVDEVGDVRTAVDEARTAGRSAILFQVEREGGTAFVAVPF